MSRPAPGSLAADVSVKKVLTPEEQFAQTDFTNRGEIVALFPDYVQEQYAIKLANKKNVTKAVDIEGFSLKTPFGDRFLLKYTKLQLEPNRRQCLFGQNATGKTLLFVNIAERTIRDFPKHLHIHHCKELENHELSDTVLGTVVNCYPYRNMLIKVEKKLRELLTTADGDIKSALQDNLDYVLQQMQSIRGFDAEERAAKMLRVLGFDDIGQKKPCSALSGGLRMRVALCMAFFIEADLLLLDEPTNHLDFPSVLWLENRLRGYKGSFLLVSHDRELLNNVCGSVLLIEDLQIKYYIMGFKEFEKKKAEEDKKKFDEIEKFLKKNPNADPSTQLGKEKHEKKEWSENYYRKQIALAGKFTFPAPVELENKEVDENGQPVPADQVSIIDLKNVRFSYDVSTNHYIFNDPISFKVTASTRVGVMGPNGAGKSTLLKLLTHKLKPTEGTVTHHPNFQLSYFGQHSTLELDLECTAAEFMEKQFPGVSVGLLRQHLAKTSITGTVADTRMARLSFSQRSCIIFAKLTYICPHLLIMDEPTNFLDLESVDALISACNKYKGALLLVSHNRDFLKKCAKQYLSVVPGQFKLFDKLKEAENATYSFIAEMEDGVKVGSNVLQSNPGGGSVHSSQKVGAAAEEEKKTKEVEVVGGVKVLTIGSAPMAAKPKPAAAAAAPAAPAAEKFEVKEKCLALWSDGKHYAAVIEKVLDGGKYQVKYTQYGNSANLSGASLKKLDAAKSAAAGGAGKGQQQQQQQQQQKGQQQAKKAVKA